MQLLDCVHGVLNRSTTKTTVETQPKGFDHWTSPTPGPASRIDSRHVDSAVGPQNLTGHESGRIRGQVQQRVRDVDGLAGQPER